MFLPDPTLALEAVHINNNRVHHRPKDTDQQQPSHHQQVIVTPTSALSMAPTPRKKSSGSLLDGVAVPPKTTQLKARNRRPIAKLHRNASSSLNLYKVTGSQVSGYLPDGIIDQSPRLRRLSVRPPLDNQEYVPPPDAVTPPPGLFRIYTYQGSSSDNEDALDLDTDIENTMSLDGPQSFYTIGSAPDSFIVDEDLPPRAAVLQFRTDENFTQVKLYILDLRSEESAAKTRLLINENPIESLRYIEVLNKDALRVEPSRRDYLFMLA